MKLQMSSAFILLLTSPLAMAQSKDNYFNCLKGFSSRIEIAGKMEPYEKKSLGDVLMLDGKPNLFMVNDKNELFLIPYPSKPQIKGVEIAISPMGPKGKWKANGEPEGKAFKSEVNYLQFEVDGKKTVINLSKSEPYENKYNEEPNYQYGMIRLIDPAYEKIVEKDGYGVSRPSGLSRFDKDRAHPVKIELEKFKAKDPANVMSKILKEKVMAFVDFRLDNAVKLDSFSCSGDEWTKKDALNEIENYYQAAKACSAGIQEPNSKNEFLDVEKKLETYIKENHLKFENNKLVSTLNCKEKPESVNSTSRTLLKEKVDSENPRDINHSSKSRSK